MNSGNSKKSIDSIVVRGTNWVGDAIMTIPAMRELSRIFPNAEIVLHTRSWAEGIFRDADFIDEIISFEKSTGKLKGVFEQSDVLAARKFDLAVLFPNSFESALTVFMARIPKRIGYNKDLRGLLLTEPIAVPEWKGHRHEVYYYLNLVAEIEKRFLGTQTVLQNMPDASLDISHERKTFALDLLAKIGVDPAKKTVALGVGSTNSLAKRWPADKYAGLSDRLQRELNVNVILAGAANEIDVSEEVAALSKNPPIILTGKTDLAEAAAILSVVDLLISNDMGLAHIAPSTGTKTLVIFGPTNPETTRPYSNNAVVILHQTGCEACLAGNCRIDHRSMELITVDDVFDIAAENLTETIEE